ncbi:MAG: hypothetical protein NTY53_26480 [Kiritimatiellaeota bacterium]|nr:hypothetical protein [Kiritimatiellota bacterium]
MAQVLANTGAWCLCGALDMDADGAGDLLWQTPDGTTAGWFMNGNCTLRTAQSWGTTSGWKLKAAGR